MQEGGAKNRLEKLAQIYEFWDRCADRFDAACRPTCAACCTCNVTMTGLETRYILSRLEPDRIEAAKKRIQSFFPARRFQPELTTNRFARYCMEEKDVKDPQNDPAWGNCPLLADGICSIYPVRPMGCRIMISEIDCGSSGYAQVPSLAQTLQTLFAQAVEHLDQNGVTGNLSDMLMHDPSGGGDSKIFAQNEKISVLMVPPEHRERVDDILRKLSSIISG